MKKGFTLVELSIVLIIIGLLVGGILVGQSLINSAKVQKTVKELSAFDAATRLFASKYKNQMPGDSKFFAPQGNGNRAIYEGSEVRNYFTHLSAGVSLVDQKNKPYNATNQPVLSIDSAAKAYNPILMINVNQLDAAKGFRHFYWYRSSTAPYGMGGYAAQDPAKPGDIFALDAKFDDGKPFAGDIYVTTYGTYTTDKCGVYNVTGGSYETNNSFVCTVWIAIGITDNAVASVKWPPS